MTKADELFELLEGYPGEGCLLWPHGLFRNGYGQVQIDGKKQLVHRLACEWAHGPAPEGKPLALHAAHEICGNRHCFAPAHVRWGSPAENSADMVAEGSSSKGESHGLAKVTEAQVVEIRERYAAGDISQRALAAEYGVSKTIVGDIVLGRTWAHVGGPIKGIHY